MGSNLRVAMMINGYYPRVGGAERQLGSIAPLLQHRGVNVHILTRRYQGFKDYEEVEGVPVHRLPVPGPKPLASLSYTFSALTLLAKLQPDVIHAHEMFSTTTTAVAAAALWKKPVVVTAHSSGYFGDIARLKKKLLGPQRLFIFRNKVDHFIVISQKIDQEFEDIGVPAGKRTYIPNGVDSHRFHPVDEDQKREIRKRLGFPQDGLIAVFTGRLSEEKRPANLLNAWPVVHERFRNSLLLIAGSGSQEEELRNLITPGVRMLGEIKDVVPFMLAADLFVLPSAAEGLPVSLLEAMACGLPAVATAVGGTPEVLVHGKTGFLIPPDDLLSLQTAINNLFSDSQLRTQMGALGREVVVSNFSLDIVVGKLFDLYNQLASSSSRRKQ